MPLPLPLGNVDDVDARRAFQIISQNWRRGSYTVFNLKENFGARGDGSTDDTAAFNAAIAKINTGNNRIAVYVPPGSYKVTAALSSITTSNWRIFGAGYTVTRVFTTANAPVFTVDASATTVFFAGFSDMAIEGSISGTYSSSVGILVAGDTGSVTGLQYAKFQNLQFRDLYRGIYLEDTGKTAFGGVDCVSAHLNHTYENIRIPVATANAVFEGFATEGAGPGISQFLGGHWRGSNAAIRIGSGGALTGIGDLLFNGVHVVIADIGIDIFGPTNASAYDQNITIVGCQLDNCTTATIRADRVQNCRFGPNNSTASVGLTLTNSTNIFFEDRNTFSFPKPIAVNGATASTSTALMTSAGTTAVSSLRIPHGAAPTSPVDGDMWTTSAGGLFVRINGVTVGPLT